MESPNGVGVVGEGVKAALRSEGPELDRGCTDMREILVYIGKAAHHQQKR
jgi:hypothetical protein